MGLRDLFGKDREPREDETSEDEAAREERDDAADRRAEATKQQIGINAGNIGSIGS